MPRHKRRLLILMAGPKFDLERDFGPRLEGLSQFSCGYLIVSSSVARNFEAGNFKVISTVSEIDTLLKRFGSRLTYIRECFRVVRASRNQKQPIEIVVTYDPLLTGLIGCMIVAGSGAKLICEVNGEYTAAANFMHESSKVISSIKRRVAGFLTRFVLARADGIKTLFPEQLANLGYRPKPKQLVMQIPEYVNTSLFKKLGEEPVILLVGFPFFVKGVDIAIKAFRSIAPRYPEWRLKIIGYYPDLRQLDDAIGNCGQIEHHPPVPNRQMNDHLGRCAIVLQSSRTEAMGRVLVEAMAAEKARVASRVGGIPTVVEDGLDGLLVGAEDVSGLAAALERLIRDPRLREQLAKNGAARAAREFTPAQYFKRIERLLSRVVPA